MDSTLRDRLRHLADNAQSLRDLDRAAALSEGYFQAALERIDDPKRKTLERIAEATGASPAWLAFGIGDAPSPETIRAAVAAHQPTSSDEGEDSGDPPSSPVVDPAYAQREGEG